MAVGKRYYWMKLKEQFMTSDAVDYLMSQKDGANYVVLYQMLCLKTINTGGRLSRKIGEIVIPYDIPKIQRDLKWFSVDTIRVALELYKSFGLIYEGTDGVLALTEHQNLVGSETDWAKQKTNQRQAKALTVRTDIGGDIQVDIVHTNVHTDIDNREKILDIDKDISTTTTTAGTEAMKERTTAPTYTEIAMYMKNDLCIDNVSMEAEKFQAYNELLNWSCLPNWKAAAHLWCSRIGEKK